MNRYLFERISCFSVPILIVSILIVSIASLSCIFMQSAYGFQETGLIVPLYSYPGTDWDTLVKEKITHPSIPVVAIINPDSGPGIKDPNYLYSIQKLQAVGIKVIGYIYTANTDYKTIVVNIHSYKDWYNVDGIFFDQMSNVKGNESFYRNLTNYSKSIGLNFTVGNPGTDTLPSYVGTVNNIVIYDDPNLPPISSFDGWHKNFTKINFSFISYGVKNLDENYLQAVSKHVQYVYISNFTLPNPFNSLPGYVGNLFSALENMKNKVSVNPTPIKNDVSLTANYNLNKDIHKIQTNYSTKQILKNKLLDQHCKCSLYQSNQIPQNGSISIEIAYAAGDRAYSYGVSLKIYQDSNQSVYRNMDSISSNPLIIDSLPLDHTYKIMAFANGMSADVEYVHLDKTTQQFVTKNLVLHLYPPGGMRPNIFYNDGFTPIPNAFVSIKDQNNKTWGMDNTDPHGQTLRFWLEPTITNGDYYVVNVKIGQRLSYNFLPVLLNPGLQKEINIVTPWPPIVNSLITVKSYDKNSTLLSKKNKFEVDLLDQNRNLISQSEISYHGEANFSNLKIGDYVLCLKDPVNGTNWGESHITLDGTLTSFNLIKSDKPLGISTIHS